jgi:predicted nucleic acid-binding protein
MILVDTGFIVAVIRADDRNHQRCRQVLQTIRTPFVTTWPCVTEAMHLLGHQGRETLRAQIVQGVLTLHPATQQHAERACFLMQRYADAPMDFADASLVVAAEVLNLTRILTIDRHFYAYRINDHTPFEVLP